MIGERVNRVRVRTPEGVVFTFPLAGPVTRFLAWLVDAMVVVAAGTLIGFVTAFIGILSADLAMAVSVLLYFVLSTGYGIVLEWVWRGQTIGKKLLRLRVIDEGGLPLSVSQVMLRNLLRAVDVLPVAYFVGGASMLLSRRAQRLGDLAAGTVVVRHRRSREPDLAQLFEGKFNSLRVHPHLAARLRQRVPAGLAAAGVDALLRRETLEPAARLALFAELADAFRRLVVFPPETLAGIPDEAFVRNAVEIVHETTTRARTPDTSATAEAGSAISV